MNRALILLGLALISGCNESVITKKDADDNSNCVECAMNSGDRIPKQKLAQIVQVVEAKLVSAYGDSVLRERPWKVKETATGYEVTGNPDFLKGRKGGVARMVLDKDLNIMSVTHGK